MLTLALVLVFMCPFLFILGMFPMGDNRPRLQNLDFGDVQVKQPSTLSVMRAVAMINRPICVGDFRRRIIKDLNMGQVNFSPEEFVLIKELAMILLLAAVILTVPFAKDPLTFFIFVCGALVVGWMAPEFWLKGRIRAAKEAITRELPDTIDLLGLCVNAGLDFMLALKWVIEKSPPSVLMRELKIVMQEINLGKTRRDALRDLAQKYELQDLASLSRTLIQADKMGTSVSDALKYLAEDMRESRFRRGEAMALKAPLKLLVPLMFCIFPVVFILVAGPIFLDFFQNNSIQQLTR